MLDRIDTEIGGKGQKEAYDKTNLNYMEPDEHIFMVK